MSQASFFDPAIPDRPCHALWRGTCLEPATCQIAAGVGEWRDACTCCADGREGHASTYSLTFRRVGLDVDTADPAHRFAVRLPGGYVRTFREQFRAAQYADRFDGEAVER